MSTFQWKETSPGRFERDVDGWELVSVKLNSTTIPPAKESLLVLGGVSVEHSFEEREILNLFKNAWKVIRYDHPSLFTTIESLRRVYQILKGEDVDDWLEKSVMIVPVEASQQMLDLEWNGRTTLYLGLEKSNVNVAIQCSHDRIDGHGMVYLLKNLTKLVSNPKEAVFGDEASNLSPALCIAAGESSNPTPEHINEVRGSLMAFGAAQPSIGLKPISVEECPSKTRRKVFTFSAIESSAIVTAVRGRDLTVTHAFHAAFILAVKNIGHGDGMYSHYAPFSLRRYLQPPFNSSAHPGAGFVLNVPIVVTPGDFTSTAAHFKKFYTSISSHPAILPLAQAYGTALAAVLGDQGIEGTQTTAPNLASLGVLDSMFGVDFPGLRLGKPWVGLVVSEHSIVAHLWSWKGEIVMGTCYNETYYTDEMVESFVAEVVRCLSEGLQLRLDPSME